MLTGEMQDALTVCRADGSRRGLGAPGREAGATRAEQRAAAQCGQHAVPSVPRVEPFSLWQSAADAQDPRVRAPLQPVHSELPVRTQGCTRAGGSAQVTAGSALPLSPAAQGAALNCGRPCVVRRAAKARPEPNGPKHRLGDRYVHAYMHTCMHVGGRVSVRVCVRPCVRACVEEATLPIERGHGAIKKKKWTKYLPLVM